MLKNLKVKDTTFKKAGKVKVLYNFLNDKIQVEKPQHLIVKHSADKGHSSFTTN